MFKKLKKWLEQMAERNEQRFGAQRLDCCGLNRSQNPVKHAGQKPALADKK